MDQDNLPPGFRFHPTDEELITYYLGHKVSDFIFSPKAIADVDFNKCEPWDLPDKAKMGTKEWYFFSLRDRKYPTGLRTNRATDSGYWKTTGKDKEIFHCGAQVGMKKTLVFYMGRAPKGEKTNWVMHEYRHQTNMTYKPKKEEWVVCRVFKKSPTSKKPVCAPSQSVGSMLDSAYVTSVGDLGDIDMSAFNNFLTPPTSFNPPSTNTDNKVDINMYMNWILSNGSKPMQLSTYSTPLQDVSVGSMSSNTNLGFNFASSSSTQQPQLFGGESIWEKY